jgi:acetylornithine deacetylase
MALEPVRLTCDLVSIDTVSSKPCEPLVRRILDELEPLGGEVSLQRKPGHEGQVNLLARFGPDTPGGLALAGHLDTVPWDPSMRATTRPERDGRKLYGRGTCDMKGAIAGMIHAVAAIDRAALRKPVWLAFTFEEEIGCHGAKLMAEVGPLQAEHCIIGEPTGLRPVTAHKGYVIADISFQGTPCHSSDPGQGASALRAAARSLEALLSLGEEWRAQPDPSCGLEPPWTTVNVGLLRGGTARNVVPESASLTLEMRPLPGLEVDLLLGQARAVVEEATRSVGGVSATFFASEKDEPFANSAGAPLVQWLVEATGHAPSTVPFYTEAAITSRMGASTCVCGPGEIAQAHRVDEWVELDALEAAAQLYRRAIEEFCT